MQRVANREVYAGTLNKVRLNSSFLQSLEKDLIGHVEEFRLSGRAPTGEIDLLNTVCLGR